ncbi:hypothetical protein ACFC14_12885 [Microbacterium sp. NPDC055988]|uniref:hypothetical protein n=1 Tax=Microbacterium sp. NPDC055988 TaxID=3345671 RepID=UPI0035E1AB15
MNARQLRLLRAAAVSSVATLLAALSHTFGGGAAPHPLLILAVATLLTPFSALLVGSRQSRGRVAAAVFVAQGAFHLLFQALGSPTGADTVGVVGHDHHLDLDLLGPATAETSLTTMMLLAHIAAALLTTVLVWHGEALLRSVVRWVEAMLQRAATVAPAEHPRPPRLRSTLLPSFDAAVLAAVPRRGPPALIRD